MAKTGTRSGRLITAKDLVELLRVRHSKDVFVDECNTGSSSHVGCSRMDAWAMAKSWANPCVTGYELKVSRSDFLGDDKWRGYLDYCNEFYFVAPPKLIDPSELPEEAGLLVCSANATRLYSKKKSPRRGNEIPNEIFRYILFSRAKITRGYWIRDQKIEFWRDWLAGKQNLLDLGHRVGKRIQERIEEEVMSARSEQHRLKSELGDLEYVRDALRKLGFDKGQVPAGWRFDRRLEDLRRAVPRDFLRTCTDAQRELNDLVEALGRLDGQDGHEDGE